MIGKKMKQMRKKLGITQAELAKRCKRSQQQISKWESGKVTPSSSTSRYMAFGMSILRPKRGRMVAYIEKFAIIPANTTRVAFLTDQAHEALQESVEMMTRMGVPREEFDDLLDYIQPFDREDVGY